MFGVSWFRGLLGVWLLRVCVVLSLVCVVVFILLLVLFCFGLSAVLWSSWLSSGWLSWLCCSVRFFAPVRCIVLVLVHAFFALLVVLGGSWSSSAVSGASRSSSFVVLLLV